jgi:glycosyltransferase involved in cell wall biosynthesis
MQRKRFFQQSGASFRYLVIARGAPVTRDDPRVIQFCHSYDAPFLDCARQYAVLFRGTSYKVTTVYLTGKPSDEVVQGSASDEVIFLDFSSKDVRGLKLAAIKRFKQIVAEREVKFCIAHRAKPTYVALLATKLPVISIHHAFDDYKRWSRRLFASLFKRRLYLIGVSNAVRDDIRKCLPGWPVERIEALYNRISIASAQQGLFSRSEARAQLGLPENAWIVGNVGRLHPDKDQATLLRGFAQALPQLPQGSLLAIIGSGPLEQALQEQARDLGIEQSVRFLGKVPDARRYFMAFDIFALTSDHEPFGMVLLEAMVAGVPLICSDCGGGREIVEGVGRLFPLGNAGALARVLIEILSEGVDLDVLKIRMLERIEGDFTDDAARRRFWSLPLQRMIEAEQAR